MKKFILSLLCVVPSALPQTPNAQFDGETFVRQFTNGTPDGSSLVEYVRPAETVKNWTRMVAVRYFPKLENPKNAVADLARTVQQHNPRAKYQILAKDGGNDAQIDFLTWTPKTGTHGEFNIHRYLKVEGYPGLISYQFAYRFSPKDPTSVEVFKQNRERWIREMTTAEFKIPFSRQPYELQNRPSPIP